jgi:hypothetical protein
MSSSSNQDQGVNWQMPKPISICKGKMHYNNLPLARSSQGQDPSGKEAYEI